MPSRRLPEVRARPRAGRWCATLPLAALALSALGCRAKDKPPESAAAAADRGGAATGFPAADTIKPAKNADSARRAPPGPRRDSAFGPKFGVDSTGKVTPLKKKP